MELEVFGDENYDNYDENYDGAKVPEFDEGGHLICIVKKLLLSPKQSANNQTNVILELVTL